MINCRMARIEDTEQVADLFNQYRCFYEQKSNPSQAHDFIAERIRQGDSQIVVAETEDRRIVGFTQLYPVFSSLSASKAWILNDLFTEERYRRSGIGNLLIEKSIEFCRNSGASSVSLETAKDNHTAKSLYLKFGFSMDESFDHYHLSL